MARNASNKIGLAAFAALAACLAVQPASARNAPAQNAPAQNATAQNAPARNAPQPAAKPEDVAALRSCLDAVGHSVSEQRQCMLTIRNRCVVRHEQPETTIAYDQCARDEQRAWDVLLNERYAEARRRARGPEVSQPLLASQRAWITMRDTSCSAQAARYRGGTIGGPAHALCMLDMTAERAIWLSYFTR